MARNLRQSKILEIISDKEIETQDDLARELSLAGYEITQATISRDIKEIGIIKLLSSTGKYKYAVSQSDNNPLNSKVASAIKDVILSVRLAGNLVYLKTLSGGGALVTTGIDKLNIDTVIGSVSGIDNALLVCETPLDAELTASKINKFLEE